MTAELDCLRRTVAGLDTPRPSPYAPDIQRVLVADGPMKARDIWAHAPEIPVGERFRALDSAVAAGLIRKRELHHGDLVFYDSPQETAA